MGESNQELAVKKKVEKPLYKFIIGFVGGFFAATFPRLMAALTMQDSSELVLLSAGYLSIAVLFGVMIGSVVMIMEWGVPKEPGSTFMTALGLPALLAGALNTTNGAHMLEAKSQENMKLAEVVRSVSDIPEVSIGSFTPLSDASGTGKSKSLYSVSFNIISVAEAGETEASDNAFDLNPALKFKEKHYYIILQEVASEAEAKQRAIEIRAILATAQAIKAGDKYYVIDSKAKPKPQAVLEIIELKKSGFNPGILEKK